MMSWAFWVFVITLLVLHFVLHLAFGFASGAPDFMTIALLLAARRMTRPAAALFGAALGVLRDALALIAFGADAVAMGVIGYIGSRTRELFVGDSTLFLVVYLFLGKLTHDVIQYALRAVSTGMEVADTLGVLLRSAPIQAVYAALAGTVALSVYRWLNEER
ncbi:MAG: rod shape-determining protein MreD [Longimicrobiales bacterium]